MNRLIGHGKTAISKVENNLDLTVGFLLVALLAIVAWPHIIALGSSDSISYISAAQHLLEGNLSMAITGYWSPAIILPLSLLMLLGFGGAEAFMLLQVLILATVVWSASRWAKQLNLRGAWPLLFSVTSVVIFSHYLVGLVQTPDMLNTLAIMEFVRWILRLKPNKKFGAKLGIILLILALVRFYNGYIVAPLTIIWILGRAIFLDKKGKKLLIKTSKQLILALLIFGAGLTTLAFTMHSKYQIFHPFPISVYVKNLPGSQVGSAHPFYTEGLIPPLDNQRHSSWEDPIKTMYPYVSDLSTDQKGESGLLARAKVSLTTLLLIVTSKPLNTLIMGVIAVLLAQLSLQRGRSRHNKSDPKDNKNFYLGIGCIIFAATYPAGYLLSYFEYRYIVPSLIIGAFGLYLLIDEMSKRNNIRQLTAVVVGLIVYVALVIQVTRADDYLRVIQASDLRREEAVTLLSPLVESGRNIASVGNDINIWDFSVVSSYHLNARYFGHIRLENMEKQHLQLAKYNISYVVSELPKLDLPGFTFLETEASQGIYIYKKD